ncbi:MAG: type II toxin-antitoxin system mRNA interferase toxin, RelE/StbE family [Patescibacteria group bacterium]
MRIEYSRRFLKDLKKCSPKIRLAFVSRLELFLGDKFYPLLNNHALGGEYSGCRSINITGDYRAVFEEYEGGKTIYFITIGTHSQLYG